MAVNLSKESILVTGGAGFLGSFVVEKLVARGVPYESIFVPRSRDYDLRKWEDCQKVVLGRDIVIHLAAKSGNVTEQLAKPGEFFYENMIMSSQLIEAARLAGVKKIVTVGSITSYPARAEPPLGEAVLWNGYPASQNAPYGLAKLIQLVQLQAYRAQYGLNGIFLIFPNLYGPLRGKISLSDVPRLGVIPTLIAKVIAALRNGNKQLEIVGSGGSQREFLYVEDAAEAIVLAAESYDAPEPLNMGSGFIISIRDMAEKIIKLMDFDGEILWDSSKFDDRSLRFLDSGKAREVLGFYPKTEFMTGLKKTTEWYLEKFVTNSAVKKS